MLRYRKVKKRKGERSLNFFASNLFNQDLKKSRKGKRLIEKEKKQLNTPINSKLLDDFRQACNDYNLNMNVVIEKLLDDFVKGNYNIILSRKEGIKIEKTTDK